MFSITPHRRLDDYDRLWRLVDDLASATPYQWGGYNAPAQYGDGPLPLANIRRLGDSEVHNTDKEFRVRLDLSHYAPEEVKITSDNVRIIINAKHEEKQDNHGFVSREMTRTYKLPNDVDPKSVTSTMNSQGVLCIKVAKKALEAPKETVIPVEFKQ